ncbi:hypothetical protein N7931_02890 [Catenovulum sp. 2E275]|uniref:tetratricopeptide repeat protein n=1 Tax=Catenovulum sp. 2E275 TaxID=2980497 RepID=UPI0021D30E2D|nr:hypothetical protein [Catenovulum sp. 2E275]MCU4674569.1 hypothetical protein [Catenovulum sp. 2E275]
MLKRIHKLISSFLLLAVLMACSSTREKTEEIITSKSNEPVESIVSTQSQRVLNFNLSLEEHLNKGELDYFIQQIDEDKIYDVIKARYLTPNLEEKDYKDSASKVLDSFVTLVQNLGNAESNNWHYLYSKPLNDNTILSLYRISLGESGYTYLNMYLDPNTLKIYDLHNLFTQFTNLDFLVQYDSFIQVDLINPENLPYQYAAIFCITELVKNNVAASFNHYKSLPEHLQQKPILLDFITRKLATLPVPQARIYLPELIKAYKANGQFPGMLESFFVSLSQYSDAIKAINTLPESAQRDSKMQSELAILYAYLGDKYQALHHARNTILSAPSDPEGFFVLLQVNILIKDFDLAVAVLDTINTAFDANLTPANLSLLEQSEAFLQSAQYQNWLMDNAV